MKANISIVNKDEPNTIEMLAFILQLKKFP